VEERLTDPCSAIKLNTSEMQEFINLDKEKGADKVFRNYFQAGVDFLSASREEKSEEKCTTI